MAPPNSIIWRNDPSSESSSVSMIFKNCLSSPVVAWPSSEFFVLSFLSKVRKSPRCSLRALKLLCFVNFE